MSVESATGRPADGLVRHAAPLRQQVVEAIRRDILDGTYPGQARLTERALCDKLQVSRTVVREALRQLETEQLVQMVPNVGPIVRSLTRDEVRSLYEVRAALESCAGAGAARYVDEDLISRLDEAIKTVERSARSDRARLLAAKDQFLGVLISGSKNAVIGEMLSSIHARVSQLRAVTLRSPGRIKFTIAELHAIRDAVASGDEAGAAAACRVHVERAAEIALDSLTESE